MKIFKHSSVIPIVLVLLLFSASASANNLQVDPNSPWFLHLGAAILLYLHIGGGALGIVTGMVASLSKKGSYVHRTAGKVFLLAMFVCYLIGALVSPFLESQQSTNFVASILALYLLISGVSAARRTRFEAGISEKIGVVVAVSIVVIGALFMVLAYQSPNGSVDGSPPQAYILFVIAASAALFDDIYALIRKKISNGKRIVRHLWRMCMSFFIASGSLFFGQMLLFPVWFQESLLPFLLGFFPLLVLITYLIKTAILSFISRRKRSLKSNTL